jgi:hypothetical protein
MAQGRGSSLGDRPLFCGPSAAARAAIATVCRHRLDTRHSIEIEFHGDST